MISTVYTVMMENEIVYWYYRLATVVEMLVIIFRKMFSFVYYIQKENKLSIARLRSSENNVYY